MFISKGGGGGRGGGTTGISSCHQTGGPITGWAYNQYFTVYIVFCLFF